MNAKPSLLVVEDQDHQRTRLVTLFADPPQRLRDHYQVGEFVVDGAVDEDEAQAHLGRKQYDVVLLDLHIPGKGTVGADVEVGKSLFNNIREYPWTATVVITQYASTDVAVAVFRKGAIDFISKNIAPTDEEIFQTVVRAHQRACQDIKIRMLQQTLERERRHRSTAIRTREQADNFTRAAAELLTRVADSVQEIKKLLKSRFGIEVEMAKTDELCSQISRIDSAIKEGLDRFRKLRDSSQIELHLKETNVAGELKDLVARLYPWCGSRRVRIQCDLGKVNDCYRLFLRDFQDAVSELLMCALENANPESEVWIKSEVDQKNERIAVSVNFSKDTPAGGGDKVLADSLEDSFGIVRTLAKSMGGEAVSHLGDGNTVSIELQIPVISCQEPL